MYKVDIISSNSVGESLEFESRFFAECAFDHIQLHKGEYVELVRYPENTNYAFILESRYYYS